MIPAKPIQTTVCCSDTNRRLSVVLIMSERKIPTISESLVFKGKSTLLQINRTVKNLFDKKFKRFSINNKLIDKAIIAESKTALWTESDEAEKVLLVGKVQNLRVALRKLNGLEIPANGTFSFWAQVGRASRLRGFVEGRELREGCIIPNIGGGLCQLSNALYDAALKAGFEIMERHAHTQVISGSLAEKGRDATVFWNYVDLRFRFAQPFRIEAKMDAENLIVSFRSDSKATSKQVPAQLKKKQEQNEPQSCMTCGVGDCFRNVTPKDEHKNFGRAAFLVDEFFPEFDDYIQSVRTEKDLLVIPIDGKRFRKSNYAWTLKGFKNIKQSLMTTLIRSYQSRKLSAQGAARQRALLSSYEQLADSFSRSLSFDVTHVCVQQNLLPYLWREGHLGGRTFDVLMNALPMKHLQERLDTAKELHPESKTLADFRADDWIVNAELEALKYARKIITPHTEIASLFPEKTLLLNWKIPVQTLSANGHKRTKIIFPASTVGRKGAYELREALQGLNAELVTIGSQIEGEDFWHGLSVEYKNGSHDWLTEASAVVLPAFVEHKPRRLLQAVAYGVPVIASTACGVENVEGVINVPVGDVMALRSALQKVVENKV